MDRCITQHDVEAYCSLRNNPKYLVCSKDVADKIDEKCELKSNCEMKVTDLENKEDDFCLPGKYINTSKLIISVYQVNNFDLNDLYVF